MHRANVYNLAGLAGIRIPGNLVFIPKTHWKNFVILILNLK